MPPLDPPTGDGPGTLAVRRMSGRLPGRDIGFWNAVCCGYVSVLFIVIVSFVVYCLLFRIHPIH